MILNTILNSLSIEIGDFDSVFSDMDIARLNSHNEFTLTFQDDVQARILETARGMALTFRGNPEGLCSPYQPCGSGEFCDGMRPSDKFTPWTFFGKAENPADLELGEKLGERGWTTYGTCAPRKKAGESCLNAHRCQAGLACFGASLEFDDERRVTARSPGKCQKIPDDVGLNEDYWEILNSVEPVDTEGLILNIGELDSIFTDIELEKNGAFTMFFNKNLEVRLHENHLMVKEPSHEPAAHAPSHELGAQELEAPTPDERRRAVISCPFGQTAQRRGSTWVCVRNTPRPGIPCGDGVCAPGTVFPLRPTRREWGHSCVGGNCRFWGNRPRLGMGMVGGGGFGLIG